MVKSSSRLFALERQRKIAERVREQGSVRASDLINLFGVTDETIRRDLSRLADLGVLRRAHGGAVAAPTRAESNFSLRLLEHEQAKIAIARVAAELVTDGSTIIIDSGTTTVHFTRALKSKRNLVVITNAVTNAIELMENPNITVVLTGGLVRPATLGAVGDLAVATLRELHVDQTFLAINSASIEGGLTYPSFEEVAVKRAMIAAGSEVILLADHSKFGHDSLVRVAPLDVLTRIVTSVGIAPDLAAMIREIGIELIVACETDAPSTSIDDISTESHREAHVPSFPLKNAAASPSVRPADSSPVTVAAERRVARPNE
jgi:DeoR family fructose operon transcriptional repressor